MMVLPVRMMTSSVMERFIRRQFTGVCSWNREGVQKHGEGRRNANAREREREGS